MSFNQFRNLDHGKQFKYLKFLTDKDSVEFAWKYFVNVYTENSKVELQQPLVHFVAHQIGELIYNKRGFNGITVCTTEFSFGCYHGFLDKAFSKDLSGLEKAVSGCKRIGPVGSNSFEGCAHGIGHGIASYYLVSDLQNSLKTCETLSAGNMSCADGVFMEFSIDAPLSFYRKSDPLYPCDVVDKKYSHICGKNQVPVMEKFSITQNNIARLCYDSLNESFQLGCFEGLTYPILYISQGNGKYILEKCSETGLSQFRTVCLKTAAGELTFHKMQGWEKSSIFLCDAMSGKDRKDCNDYIFGMSHQSF